MKIVSFTLFVLLATPAAADQDVFQRMMETNAEFKKMAMVAGVCRSEKIIVAYERELYGHPLRVVRDAAGWVINTNLPSLQNAATSTQVGAAQGIRWEQELAAERAFYESMRSYLRENKIKTIIFPGQKPIPAKCSSKEVRETIACLEENSHCDESSPTGPQMWASFRKFLDRSRDRVDECASGVRESCDTNY